MYSNVELQRRLKRHLNFATVIPLSFRVRIAFTSDSGWWETKCLLLLRRITLHLTPSPWQQGNFGDYLFIRTELSVFICWCSGPANRWIFLKRIQNGFQKFFFLNSRKYRSNREKEEVNKLWRTVSMFHILERFTAEQSPFRGMTVKYHIFRFDEYELQLIFSPLHPTY